MVWVDTWWHSCKLIYITMRIYVHICINSSGWNMVFWLFSQMFKHSWVCSVILNFGRSFTSYSVAMNFLSCIFIDVQSAKVDSMVGLKLTNLQVLDEWKLLCHHKLRNVEIDSQFSPLLIWQCSKRLSDWNIDWGRQSSGLCTLLLQEHRVLVLIALDMVTDAAYPDQVGSLTHYSSSATTLSGTRNQAHVATSGTQLNSH